ncbi:MAG: hypothetical protein RMI04_09370, partial [Thermofilaceae archaeon]|nr:hypothetical protein [Thermofilaceae archaeon]
QFFPSCCLTLLYSLTTLIMTSFNSFPVAVKSVDVMEAARKYMTFNSFPVASELDVLEGTDE